MAGEPAVPQRALASARPAGVAAALEPEIDIASIEPQLAILQPSDGFAPPVPTMQSPIAHLPGQRVRLTVNGRPVSELNFDGTEPNAAKSAALSRWRGVDLVAGENRLVATVVDAEPAPRSPCSSARSATAAAACARSSSPRSRS